jgi:hypothetical protein
MKTSTEINDILRKSDRTNAGMTAKTPDISKSHLVFTNEMAWKHRGSESIPSAN